MATTAGTITSSNIAARSVTVTVGAATGGATTPYTYQWYRSITSGFSPGGGNSIAGATALVYSDSGLTPGTKYYYKNVATDSSATPVTSTAAQVEVDTIAYNPNPNQFDESVILGMSDLQLNYNSISVQFDSAGSGTLAAGQAVKWSTAAGKVPQVVPSLAAADVLAGFVNYNIKNRLYNPGDYLDISCSGNVIYLVATAAINRGVQVTNFPAAVAGGCNGGVLTAVGSGGLPIVGVSLDTVSSGDFVRILLALSPSTLS